VIALPDQSGIFARSILNYCVDKLAENCK
jgi:hypothetical protein